MAPPTHARDGNTPKALGQDGGKLSNPLGSVLTVQVLTGLWFTGNPWGKGSVNEENRREHLDV